MSRFGVEVLIDGRWQLMKHKFEERFQADTIAKVARGASDCQDARVVELTQKGKPE